MRLIALYSGGKDSTLAIDKAVSRGHEVISLVTVVPSRTDSWMFHTIALDVVPFQAEALGIPHRVVNVSGEREKEVRELADLLAPLITEFDADGLLSGAIASSYQKARVDRVARELGLEHVAPNWGIPAIEVVKEVLRRGYKVMVSGVSAYGMGREWIGRYLDWKSVEELERMSSYYGLNPAGEGGEFETLVLDCPIYRFALEVEFDVSWSGHSGHILPKYVRRVEKRSRRESSKELV